MGFIISIPRIIIRIIKSGLIVHCKCLKHITYDVRCYYSVYATKSFNFWIGFYSTYIDGLLNRPTKSCKERDAKQSQRDKKKKIVPRDAQLQRNTKRLQRDAKLHHNENKKRPNKTSIKRHTTGNAKRDA